MKRFYLYILSLILLGGASYAQKEITLEDIWAKPTFRAKGINEIRSMNDGENYCVLTSGSIDKYNYKSKDKTGEILSFDNLSFSGDSDYNYIVDYNFSSDEKKILLAANPEFIYRRSFVADYYVYDVETKEFFPLSKGGKQRLAEFSPDGSKVGFVRDNNIFIVNLEKKTEKQITKDGEFNKIIYGTTDWVYEEEFAITKGFFWNNQGNKIAYYRFDESKVKEFSFTLWGGLYTEEYRYKYPKAGEDNSIVDIYIYDLGTDKHNMVDLGSDKDYYLPRMQWSKGDNQLVIHKLNRLQNHYQVFAVDANSLNKKIIYEERNKYFVDEPENLYFLDNKKEFIIKSERDGFWNLYMVDIESGKLSPITNADYDIEEICFIDEKAKKVYYTAAKSSPINRELLVINFNGKKEKQLSKEIGTHSADFSKSGKYYISTFSDANTPSIYKVKDNSGKTIITLEDNAKLRERIKEYGDEKKEFSSFETTEGVSINYWMIKPSNMEKGRKYPVLFFVYSGPGSQEVLNSQRRASDIYWYKMLAQKGYITICVDPRGTGMRGEEFRKQTYLQLGKYESDDIIEAAKYFGGLDYVDEDRIGIFGWSYGGYMSSICITKGADVFKSAIAVAPVTNWRYYDNIYTERFMRTPQENGENYDINSPINFVDKLKGNYLLIHGTADDNVHVQNAIDMSTALIEANKQFEQFYYPNKNHGIYGGNTRLHLYELMTDFILRKL